MSQFIRFGLPQLGQHGVEVLLQHQRHLAVLAQVVLDAVDVRLEEVVALLERAQNALVPPRPATEGKKEAVQWSLTI